MRSHGRRDVCSQDHQTPDAPLGYRGIDRLTKSARKPSLSKGPGCILSCLSASLLVVNINWTAHCARGLTSSINCSCRRQRYFTKQQLRARARHVGGRAGIATLALARVRSLQRRWMRSLGIHVRGVRRIQVRLVDVREIISRSQIAIRIIVKRSRFVSTTRVSIANLRKHLQASPTFTVSNV